MTALFGPVIFTPALPMITRDRLKGRPSFSVTDWTMRLVNLAW